MSQDKTQQDNLQNNLASVNNSRQDKKNKISQKSQKKRRDKKI